MTIKVYDGSIWQPQKSLKIYNGTSWVAAKKGWVYSIKTGDPAPLWYQFYPEYPVNTASPSISGSTTAGSVLSCTTGTWTSTDAYIPTSYSYQWKKGGVDISNQVLSTYTTVSGDVGSAITCSVTATNQRGTTTVISSNSITVTSPTPGAPTNLTLTDSTDTPPTPGAMSVSNVTQTSLNFSFGAATGTFTAYEVLTSNSNHVVSSLNQSTRTGSVTGGSAGEAYYLSAFTTNTNCKITGSWTAGTNATSYDIYVGGVYRGNTTSTSYTYTTGAVGTYTFAVYSRNASGPESTGVSGSKALAKKYSSGGTAASGNFLSSYTVTWDANGGTVSPTSSSVTPGSSVTAPTPTRSSYTFNGWYNAASGGSLIVNAGGSYTPSSSVTLYAQWTASATGPTTPTNLFNLYSGGPTWTGTWDASTGTGTITYYWTLYQSTTNGGSITATASGNTTSTTFSQSMNQANGLWAYFTVYAKNSAGTSGTATSAWA